MTIDQLQAHVQYLNLLLRRETAKSNPDRTQVAMLTSQRDAAVGRINRARNHGDPLISTIPL